MNKIDKNELHEIFIGLRKKDQNSYNKLYEKYYNLVYGIAFSIMKNKQDSEDLTHEIYTKIYKLDAEKFPTTNEASWLFTVSKNECFMYLRKLKQDINLDDIYEVQCESNELEDIIDIEYYNRLIEGLSEQEKNIVSLKILSNFTFDKISKLLNIPIGTVQWKYYKAINSLKISISSLIGAAIAFMIVISGKIGSKNKEYLGKSEDNNISEHNNENSQENSAKEVQDKVNIQSSETNVENGQDYENKSTINNEISNDVKEIYNSEIDKQNELQTNINVSAWDVALTFAGIIFLIIFIIFFKKYQQKLKRKSSKQ